MPSIIEPESYEAEEILKIPTTGSARCFVISGFANFATGNESTDGHPLGSKITGFGDGDSDQRWAGHTIHLIVGPNWNDVKDVSPTVGVAGFSFRDSDETDHTGLEIQSCTWDTVGLPEGNTNLERIRLKIEIRMCGGGQSSITKLSYHLVVIGTQFAAM